MKQTATEFLLINLLNKFPKEMEYLFELDNNLIENILKQAKEMEEQNTIEFAEWLIYIYKEGILYHSHSNKELLEIFKKEKGL